MSSRRKGSNPINRKSMNFHSSQIIENNLVEEESDDEQLTIPPDLFQDFLQLKTSTHLNTTQLMRKLLNEYNGQSMPNCEDDKTEKGNNEQKALKDHNTIQSINLGGGVNYEIVAESNNNISSPPDEDMDLDEPLDLTVEKPHDYSRDASPNQIRPTQQLSPFSMHLPTITMRNNNLPFLKTEPEEVTHVPVKIEPGQQTPTTGSLIITKDNLAEVNNHFLFNGIGSLIAVPFLSSHKVIDALPGLTGVQVPIKTEAHISAPLPMITSPTPRGRKPGRKPRGGGLTRSGKTAPGEMKIIAENTLFPGVYTSILKLPWSRRSRNKAPLTPQPVTTAEVPKFHQTVEDSSMSVASQITSHSQANNTLLLPASSQTIMSATTSQSFMMVYPNATISAVGKPVRRRGRPPKLPMLSHLLSEKKVKKPTADTNVTNVQDFSIPIPAISESPLLHCNPPVPPQLELPSIMKIEPPSPPNETAPLTVTDSGMETNGSIYQEMILSSKSLVNIRPRRRQSTEIKRGSDFMWTSFKIKPRGGKALKTSDRRKKNSVSQLQAAIFEDLESIPTEMDTEDDNTPNMFQELFHCKICNAILPANSKISHQREHRPAMLTCSSCKGSFVSYVRNDVDLEAIQCDRCSKVMSASSPNLSNNFIPSSNNKFSCDLCDGKFKSFHAFNDHRHKVHGNEKITLDTHSCEECGKIFFTTKGLNHHMKTHVDKNRPQSVEINGSKLFQTNSVDEETEDSGVDVKEFVCVFDDCIETFKDNTKLLEHVQNEHPYNGLCCPWPGCDNEYSSKEQLEDHVLIHKDEKPMKCDYCEYKCRQRNALNWHMRKHPEAAYKYRKYAASLGGD